MRAALYQAAGDVVVGDVPDATLGEPTDAGPVFDLALPLESVAEGCAAMSERRSIKTMLAP